MPDWKKLDSHTYYFLDKLMGKRWDDIVIYTVDVCYTPIRIMKETKKIAFFPL